MPLPVQRTTIEGERMTEVALGTISPLEATNTDSSLQSLVCKGALDLLEDYAVRYQAVGTKEEVCAIGIETLRSLLRLAAAITSADVSHSASTYKEAPFSPCVVSPPVPSLSPHQQAEQRGLSPQSTTPSPSCTTGESSGLLSFANELGQEGQRDRARRSVLITPPLADVNLSETRESSTACHERDEPQKPSSPETPSTVATSRMSTPGTQTPPALAVTPLDAAEPSHVSQSLHQQLEIEEEGRQGHSPVAEGLKSESCHRDASCTPQTSDASPVIHVPEVVHAPVSTGQAEAQAEDAACSATQVTPERAPHVIGDSVSYASSLPESDALKTTPGTIAAEPCGERHGDGCQLPTTPLVLENTGTQAPGGQKIMKVLTRKCRAFLGRRPFCRPPLTPAPSTASPPTPATEGPQDSTSSSQSQEDGTVHAGFVSRFDVAEGRRLLGRFVVVKGPTLLEDEQGAVLRVREAGAAGHTMALKLVSLGFKSMGQDAGWEVDLNHDRELMLCQRIQEAPRHPNLIHILHTGAFDMTVKTGEEEAEGSTPVRVRLRVGFVIMPLLPCTLHKRLRRREGLQGMDADRVALGIFKALAALRDRDVVHSDLKPENILLTADGDPVVFDFGLAFLASQHQDPTGYVHAHLLSFEQLTHRPGPQPFLRSTFASDLWSAACIVADLYRRRRCPLFHLGDVKSYVADPWHLLNMTAGLISAVFKSCEGSMQDHLSHHMRPDAAPGLVPLLSRCLERDPEARPTAAQALEEMERVMGQDSEEEEEEEEV